ncbi:S1 family peptidase [Ideonella sp. BN130291]|uniref:S1 family peptidase n=1 Tax=Ideonella sp. BN130291 TaxID=3112940 RepID=UPI002E260EA1|nr:serine protease [Ideonella sp. BN130291]
MRLPSLLAGLLSAAVLLWAAGPGPADAAAPEPVPPAASAAASGASAGASAAAPPASAASGAEADTELVEPPPPPSPAGQRVYEAARGTLVQVRTLLKAQDSQATVGSGFLVSPEGHLITNFHVVSTYALQPTSHRLVYSTADGGQGALQLIDVDVAHDLALLKPVQADAFAGRGALSFRPATLALGRGERLYSLGNPLDVGFAVAEGSYNGLVERSFLPTIFFGGSLSAGMSGGPTLDAKGRVIGVNVATRRDGEQISFLVPGQYAKELLERSRGASPLGLPAYPQITKQMLVHQEALTKAFIALPWRNAGNQRYAIPVPREDFLRCWGRSTPPESRGLEFERSDCNMDSRVYITSGFSTGFISVRHEAYDGRKLGALRFAQRYSASFRNEFMGANNAYLTAPQCHERFVDRGGLPLRAVMCLRAHKKLRGLYEVAVLVATLDQSTAGVQGRFDAHGVSFENAKALTEHYLNGFAWTDPKTASR